MFVRITFTLKMHFVPFFLEVLFSRSRKRKKNRRTGKNKRRKEDKKVTEKIKSRKCRMTRKAVMITVR